MMTDIPANEVTQKDLEEWFRLQEQLKQIKTLELMLRNKIFKGRFPNPIEGTNSTPLENGYVLKGKYVINREVDQGALGAMRPKLLEAGIKADDLVQYKPSLVLKEYRTLTAEQQQLFDQVLIVKPGTPALEIVLPAAAKKAGDKK